VETGVYGLEKYYKQFRVGYTMFQSYLHGADTRYAHLISGNYYYGINNSTVGVGFSFGDEQQNVLIPGRPRGIVDVSSVGVNINGIHWFHPEWAVTYLFSVSDYDNNTNNADLYTKTGFQLGLRHRF
ncbi:MAG: YaiO family outer membrane beta-barrel protein, partial [Cyanobacteria bacterium HKST-UBA05]|nr:YaiO family outer membrane beta-barrel protein [Cyanobacteria bacterium HKST-UBA05]